MMGTETQLFISSIGWALIHFLWQGTLITFAYWIISRNIQSIHAKYWTGMTLVLVSLIVPIINTSTSSNALITNESLTVLTTSIISHQQLNFEGLIHYLISASLPYVVMIWAFTVMFLSFRLVRSWVQLAAIKHECEPNVSRELKQYIKNIAIKLDLHTIPVLKISKQVMVPAAYGILKPTVLLPLSLISQIPKDQLEAIIKHELCHLKRNDFIHNIIQLCADILLFFHPGIRWMNNDIRHIREQCCDQMVLSHDTETLTYAKALTNIAEFTNGLKLRHSVHLGINDGMLLNRVKFLLQNKSSQSSLMVFMPFLMLILFVIIMLQPAKQDLDDSITPQANVSINNDWQNNQAKETPATKKRIGSHSFYPNFNTNSSSIPANTSIPRISYESKPNTTVTETPEVIGMQPIDKPMLLNELKLDMQLPVIETEITNNEYYDYAPSSQFSTDTSLIGESLGAEVASVTDDLRMNIDPIASDSLNATSVLSSFVNTVSIKPKFQRYVAPEYPQHFWYNQIEQDVIATFKIQPNGRAFDIKLTSQNNNFIAFEQEVTKAMKRWKFDTSSLNSSTLQGTYQQIFSFAISDELERNCELITTGTRLRKSMPCNK